MPLEGSTAMEVQETRNGQQNRLFQMFQGEILFMPKALVVGGGVVVVLGG